MHYLDTLNQSKSPESIQLKPTEQLFLKRLEYGLKELSNVVEIHNEIRGGMPVLKGTRIPIATILAELSEETTITEIAEDYDINAQQIKVLIGGLAILLERSFQS
jgi:uncharacterized protein (DUF433 family)